MTNPHTPYYPVSCFSDCKSTATSRDVAGGQLAASLMGTFLRIASPLRQGDGHHARTCRENKRRAACDGPVRASAPPCVILALDARTQDHKFRSCRVPWVVGTSPAVTPVGGASAGPGARPSSWPQAPGEPETASERVPGGPGGVFEVADIGAQPGPDTGADGGKFQALVGLEIDAQPADHIG